jgi:hypothetical protein
MPSQLPEYRQMSADWTTKTIEVIKDTLTKAQKTEEEISCKIAAFQKVTTAITQVEKLFRPLKSLQSSLHAQGEETYYQMVGAYYGGRGEEMEFTEITDQRYLDACTVIQKLNAHLDTALKNYKEQFKTPAVDSEKAGAHFVSQVEHAFNEALENKNLTTHRNLFSRVFEGFKSLCNQYLGTHFEAKITNSEKYVRNRYTLMAQTTSSLKLAEEPEIPTVKPK